MGRVVKRVPMDFGWPLHKVWAGYICPWYVPHYHECDRCPKDERYGGSSGYSEKGYALVCELREKMDDRTWIPSPEDMPVLKEHYGKDYEFETPDEFAKIMYGRPVCHPGDYRRDFYVSDLSYYIASSIAEREGWELFCSKCKGHGKYWDSKEWEYLATKGWKNIEPPTGDGYQLWETTSEGSPVTPVFSSLEKLAEYCEENSTTFGSDRATKEEWLQMFNDGVICSVYKDGAGNTVVMM